jgi:hypothetical protein
MPRLLISLPLVIALFATPSHATTLAITTDKASYTVGDAITLHVTGDSQGATSYAVFGQLVWNPSLASFVSVAQQPLGSNWITGQLQSGRTPNYSWHGDWSYSDVFDQITFPTAAGGGLDSTLVLHADAPGALDLNWQWVGGSLDFFGLTSRGYAFWNDNHGALVEIGGQAAQGPLVDAQNPSGPSVPEPNAPVVFPMGLLAATIAQHMVRHGY